MGADVIAKAMPAQVGLDHLAVLNDGDVHGHRYETTPEGMLSVVPPPDSDHVGIASDLFAWFIVAGWPPRRVLQAAGVRIPGEDGDGGRIPDLTVWSKPQASSVWLPIVDLLLVIEIVSAGWKSMDKDTKRHEYAQAGIPQYWVVDRDTAQNVTLYRLSPNGTYDLAAKMPLARLLKTEPADYLNG
jgi:Uma2 family endonuclease